VDHNGSKLDRYFDVETGLCVRRIAPEVHCHVRQTVVRDDLDYRQLGELFVPTKYTYRFDGIRYVYELDCFEVDVKIPAGVFDAPESLLPKVGKMGIRSTLPQQSRRENRDTGKRWRGRILAIWFSQGKSWRSLKFRKWKSS
jgi:hypothetical protein